MVLILLSMWWILARLTVSTEDALLSRKQGILDDLLEYEELSDSEEESLSKQEDSEMQELIDLAMAETADLDNGEILDDEEVWRDETLAF